MIALSRRAILALAALVLLGPTATEPVTAHTKDEQFRVLDIPPNALIAGNILEVFAQDINNRGAIVGYWTALLPDLRLRTSGFIEFDRYIAEIDRRDPLPESNFLVALGINDRGEIAGQFFSTASNGPFGFLLSGGRAQNFNILMRGINRHGEMVGTLPNGQDSFLRLTNGDTPLVRVPGSLSTRAHKLNDRKQIVGEFDDASGHTRGFLLSGGPDGRFVTIDVPDSDMTRASDINNVGQVVGTFAEAGILSGFVWRRGVFTTIRIPDSVNTEVNGINDWGQIVGTFTDATGVSHGFQSHVRSFRHQRQ